MKNFITFYLHEQGIVLTKRKISKVFSKVYVENDIHNDIIKLKINIGIQGILLIEISRYAKV